MDVHPVWRQHSSEIAESILIKNEVIYVVRVSSAYPTDILIEEDNIAAVLKGTRGTKASEIIDALGLFVSHNPQNDWAE